MHTDQENGEFDFPLTGLRFSIDYRVQLRFQVLNPFLSGKHFTTVIGLCIKPLIHSSGILDDSLLLDSIHLVAVRLHFDR